MHIAKLSPTGTVTGYLSIGASVANPSDHGQSLKSIRFVRVRLPIASELTNKRWNSVAPCFHS